MRGKKFTREYFPRERLRSSNYTKERKPVVHINDYFSDNSVAGFSIAACFSMAATALDERR